jgi:phosphatidylglycerophosphatase A
MILHTSRGDITLRTWIACGFGLGFAPLAPGTAATIVLALLIRFLPAASTPVEVAIALSVTFAGVYLCHHAEKFLGRDAGSIVWDEFAGFLVAMIALPHTWMAVALAFVFFRLFDIAKPFPIDASQRLSGGWGVVADDLLAGIYANIAVRITLYLLG